jgi:hypothetical protein
MPAAAPAAAESSAASDVPIAIASRLNQSTPGESAVLSQIIVARNGSAVPVATPSRAA